MEDPLRVLMVSPQFRPIVGGYERAAERLAVELNNQGHAVTIVTERRDLSWLCNEQLDGVQVRRLWCVHRRHLHILSSLMSLSIFLILRGWAFQVWHVHQYGPHCIVPIVLGKFMRKPVVLKLTGSGAHGITKVAELLPLSWLTRRLIQRVDMVIATSKVTYEEACNFGIVPSRIARIPNGVDTVKYAPRSNEEKVMLRRGLGLHATGVVLFAGRLSSEKNPDGLLRAWHDVANRIPEKWLLIYLGDGPLRPRLAEMIDEWGMHDAVMLAGPRDDVERWMGAADLFVLPSHCEGLSNSLVEAMSSGVPVVSTRVSGSEEIFKESKIGVMVEPRDDASLADAITQMIIDAEERQRCGKSARAYAVARLSIQNVARQTGDLYKELSVRFR